MSNVKEKKQKNALKGMSKKTRVWLIVIASVLLAAILFGVIFTALTYSPTVLRYGSSKLKEDVYAYWLACYKYNLMVMYKGLVENDTPEEWAATDASGRSFDALFKERADREIALRFVASVLFDRMGVNLAEKYYTGIEKSLTDMQEYSYDEDMLALLKEKYGIGERQLKRVALYEAKYYALKEHMFGSDGSGVYHSAYADRLDAFYRENYRLFNVIYLTDEKSAEKQTELSALIAAGMTEESFRDYEQENSETSVTEKYPHGIYMYWNGNYSSVFSEELLSAMMSLDEAGKIVSRRDKEDEGTFYVMRYALPDAPYLTNDKDIRFSLQGFEAYAASYLYYQELEACLAEAEWVKEISDTYSMATTAKAQDYNITKFLGF